MDQDVEEAPSASPSWTGPRGAARLIDLAIGVGLWFVPGLGLLFAVAWVLLADATPGGSPGKRLLSLRVQRQRPDRPWSREGRGPDWQPPRVIESVLRNLPFGIPICLTAFGFVGLVLGGVLLVTILLFEGWMVATGSDGIRVGDILAHTRVRGLPPVAVEERLDWDPPINPPPAGS